MSDIKVNCLHCNQPLEFPQDMLGTIVDCPSCGGQLPLPSRQSQMRTNATQPQTRATMSRQHKGIPMGSMKLVLGIVIALLCLLVIVVSYISYGKAKEATRRNENALQEREEKMRQEREEIKRQANDPQWIGGAWGEKAGQFALKVANKGVSGWDLLREMNKIWNLYYRDKYSPEGLLIKTYISDAVPDGFPKKEEWEKKDSYNMRVAEARAKKAADWDRLTKEGVTCKCKVGTRWDSSGTDIAESYSDCFSYDPETEVFKVTEEIESRSQGKSLKLRLQNSPRIPCMPTEAKRLLEKKKNCLIGLRIRFLSIDKIGSFYRAEYCELTVHLVEFVVLDSSNHVLLYWHE